VCNSLFSLFFTNVCASTFCLKQPSIIFPLAYPAYGRANCLSSLQFLFFSYRYRPTLAFS
jgi:hypothetical protein